MVQDAVAQTLAKAYQVAGYSGFFNEEAVEHLRVLWARLDPDLSMLDEVACEINRMDQERRDIFARKIWFGPLSRTLARLVCWDLIVCAEDVRHCLDILDPPRDRVVRLFSVDIGKVLASTLSFGDGGSTRARFLLVALANVFWRKGPQSIGASPSSVSLPVRFGEHFVRSFTLYWSVIVCKYIPFVLRSYTLVRIVQEVRRVIRGLVAHPGPEARRKLAKLAGMVVLISTLREYRQVMSARIAMLNVRLHRALLRDGYLEDPDDYSRAAM